MTRQNQIVRGSSTIKIGSDCVPPNDPQGPRQASYLKGGRLDRLVFDSAELGGPHKRNLCCWARWTAEPWLCR